MKRFKDFISESYDDDFNKHRLKQRKIVKPFIQEYIVDKLEGSDVVIKSIKPWKDDTEVILRASAFFPTSKIDSVSFKHRLRRTINVIDRIEKLLASLNIEFVIKSTGSDIEVFFDIHNDYFEKNKELLSSLKGISKYNL